MDSARPRRPRPGNDASELFPGVDSTRAMDTHTRNMLRALSHPRRPGGLHERCGSRRWWFGWWRRHGRQRPGGGDLRQPPGRRRQRAVRLRRPRLRRQRSVPGLRRWLARPQGNLRGRGSRHADLPVAGVQQRRDPALHRCLRLRHLRLPEPRGLRERRRREPERPARLHRCRLLPPLFMPDAESGRGAGLAPCPVLGDGRFRVSDGAGQPIGGESVTLTGPPQAVVPADPLWSAPTASCAFPGAAGRAAGPETFTASLAGTAATASVEVEPVDPVAGTIAHRARTADRLGGPTARARPSPPTWTPPGPAGRHGRRRIYVAEACRVLVIAPDGTLSRPWRDGVCGLAPADAGEPRRVDLSVRGPRPGREAQGPSTCPIASRASCDPSI